MKWRTISTHFEHVLHPGNVPGADVSVEQGTEEGIFHSYHAGCVPVGAKKYCASGSALGDSGLVWNMFLFALTIYREAG